MARRKRSGFAAFLEEFSPVSLFFHPATLFLVFNLLLAVAAVQLWSRYQHRIVDFQSVALTAEKIHINAPPAWAKTNLKHAILGSTETPKSLLDPALVPDAVATFQSVGWIEEIRQMEKTREGLSVDLVYRHPIALVELHSKTVPGWNKSPRLIPVDRRGVIMPESLAMQTAQPKIFLYHSDASQRRAPQHLKHIHRWTPWPDARVQDAAAIGEKLIGNGSPLDSVASSLGVCSPTLTTPRSLSSYGPTKEKTLPRLFGATHPAASSKARPHGSRN